MAAFSTVLNRCHPGLAFPSRSCHSGAPQSLLLRHFTSQPTFFPSPLFDPLSWPASPINESQLVFCSLNGSSAGIGTGLPVLFLTHSLSPGALLRLGYLYFKLILNPVFTKPIAVFFTCRAKKPCHGSGVANGKMAPHTRPLSFVGEQGKENNLNLTLVKLVPGQGGLLKCLGRIK